MTDWMTAYAKEREERTLSTKERVNTICKAFRAANVPGEIKMNYDGSGDSGEIFDAIWDGMHPELGPWREELIALGYDILESISPGWEINEGSSGTITINIAKGTVSVDHGQRIETTNYETYEL